MCQDGPNPKRRRNRPQNTPQTSPPEPRHALARPLDVLRHPGFGHGQRWTLRNKRSFIAHSTQRPQVQWMQHTTTPETLPLLCAPPRGSAARPAPPRDRPHTPRAARRAGPASGPASAPPEGRPLGVRGWGAAQAPGKDLTLRTKIFLPVFHLPCRQFSRIRELPANLSNRQIRLCNRRSYG